MDRPKPERRPPATIPHFSSYNGIYDSFWLFLSSISLSFLAFTTILAIISGHGDLCNAAYIVTSYICAMLMLYVPVSATSYQRIREGKTG